MASKKVDRTGDETANAMKLAAVCEVFLRHLEKNKSRGTVFSYSVDLGIAREYFGDGRDVRSIVVGEVADFNASKGVMKKANGKAKAEPTILKTRRVLRMMLEFAADKGMIEKAPIPEAEKRRKTNTSAAAKASSPTSPKPTPPVPPVPPPSGKHGENGRARKPRPKSPPVGKFVLDPKNLPQSPPPDAGDLGAPKRG